MENEKVLIAGGLLVGAYLLFGGGKKKSGSGLPSGEGSDDLSDLLDEFEEDLESLSYLVDLWARSFKRILTREE